MRVTVRQHDDVAGIQLERRFAVDLHPAAAFDEQVIGDEVIAAREHRFDDAAAERRLRHPRCARMHVEEERAGQPHGSQHVRQGIHETSRDHSASGLQVMTAGRAVILCTAARHYCFTQDECFSTELTTSEMTMMKAIAAATVMTMGAGSACTLAAEPAATQHRYLIERTFPEGALDGVDDNVKAKVNANNKSLNVGWEKSYANANKTKTYCIYNAPNENAVRE